MAKAKILVVEDDALVAKDLGMVLTDLGYDVVGYAASADNAVKKAAALDIVLKGQKTGIDASYEIKAKRDIPILFLTAYTDITLIDKAKNTEQYAYHVKPFHEKQLLAAIEMALHKSQIEKRLEASEGKLNAMLQSIGDPMSMMDNDLNILWTNETAKKIFGNDIIGRKYLEEEGYGDG